MPDKATISTKEIVRGTYAVSWGGRQTDWRIIDGRHGGLTDHAGAGLYGATNGKYTIWTTTFEACEDIVEAALNAMELTDD